MRASLLHEVRLTYPSDLRPSNSAFRPLRFTLCKAHLTPIPPGSNQRLFFGLWPEPPNPFNSAVLNVVDLSLSSVAQHLPYQPHTRLLVLCLNYMKARVLIVEDGAWFLHGLARTFSEEECDIAQASDGQQALKSIREVADSTDFSRISAFSQYFTGLSVRYRLARIDTCTGRAEVLRELHVENWRIVHSLATQQERKTKDWSASKNKIVAGSRSKQMKLIVAISLIALCLSGCSSYGSGPAGNDGTRLTDDEKHCLYSAALAASESPLDSDVFKNVCKKIGIFDINGNPNDNYMAFVTAHVEWAMQSETEQFKREVNTRVKAREYVNKHLP